jgi:hypothetical protein
VRGILRAIAGRCDTHDRASYSKTTRLEKELGMSVSPPPESVTDQLMNPDLIDCGNRRCRTQRST